MDVHADVWHGVDVSGVAGLSLTLALALPILLCCLLTYRTCTKPSFICLCPSHCHCHRHLSLSLSVCVCPWLVISPTCHLYASVFCHLIQVPCSSPLPRCCVFSSAGGEALKEYVFQRVDWLQNNDGKLDLNELGNGLQMMRVMVMGY